MAKFWIAGEEVTSAKLNKTGKGFDNITSIAFNSDGTVDTIVDGESGYTYKCNYNSSGQISTLQEKNGATVLQTWTFSYDSEGKLTGIVNS